MMQTRNLISQAVLYDATMNRIVILSWYEEFELPRREEEGKEKAYFELTLPRDHVYLGEL